MSSGRRVVEGIVLGASLAGCYTLQPVRGVTPEVGERVAFDVNDAGRVALGGSLGPEVSQIEGRIVERDNGDYVIAVSNLNLLRGGQQVWSGERVRIKPDYIASTYRRRLSRGRTIAVGAAGVGLIALVVTQSIKGGGGDEDRVPPDSAQTQRLPVPNP